MAPGHLYPGICHPDKNTRAFVTRASVYPGLFPRTSVGAPKKVVNVSSKIAKHNCFSQKKISSIDNKYLPLITNFFLKH